MRDTLTSLMWLSIVAATFEVGSEVESVVLSERVDSFKIVNEAVDSLMVVDGKISIATSTLSEFNSYFSTETCFLDIDNSSFFRRSRLSIFKLEVLGASGTAG